MYLSMACRNPRRGLMCEPPSVKRIDLYCHSDLSLAGFIVAAAPHAHKKCQVPRLCWHAACSCCSSPCWGPAAAWMWWLQLAGAANVRCGLFKFQLSLVLVVCHFLWTCRLQVPGCGDGVTCHVRTFLHSSCRITMSVATLPSHDALPGEDRGQVWTWLRPKGASEDSNRAVRR